MNIIEEALKFQDIRRFIKQCLKNQAWKGIDCLRNESIRSFSMHDLFALRNLQNKLSRKIYLAFYRTDI